MKKAQESWVSGHLYYHQSLDPVVRRFVHPFIVSLIQAGEMEAFFFVRDGLGGPHVRLRVRGVPGAGDRVLTAMQQAACRFLDLEPSARSLDEETIRRANEYLLAADPHEVDGSVYPDNSFRVIPFRPEVQRYGGAALLGVSLDFFTLSSVAAIELLSTCGDAPRSSQLVHAFCLLLQQALGFAADEAELLDLLRYGVDSWGERLPKVVEKADKVAEAQRDVFLELAQDSLAEVRSVCAREEPLGMAVDFLIVGAARLSVALGTDRAVRARIGGSQLHMTATRLGLNNAEEVYLSRLLTVTLREARLRGEEAFDLSWLGQKAAGGTAEVPERALSDLLPPALAKLAEVPGDPRVAPPAS